LQENPALWAQSSSPELQVVRLLTMQILP
jgi:hypothetical protein